jgi:hypothetical protein
MAMEGRLPTLNSTLTGIQYPDDARRVVKNWACHVIDLLEWDPRDADPGYELVLDALDKRLKDCGGPSGILSPKERRAWETLVLSRNSSRDQEKKNEKLG